MGTRLALFVAAIALSGSSAVAAPVTFRYKAPTPANSVTLAGSFNQWDMGATPMENRDGVWEVTVDLSAGPHQYKYVVDGSDWVTDEWAPAFSDDGFGGQNSVIVVGDEPMLAGYGSRTDGPGATTVVDTGTEVTFRFRAGATANAVSVAGSWNDWNGAADVLADPDGDRNWEATVLLEPGRHAYQFVVDGRFWLDADAEETADDGFGGRRGVIEVGESALTITGAGADPTTSGRPR